MSTPLTPQAAIDMVPGWKSSDVSLSEFSGGLSNRTFLVTREGEDYFLRLDALQPGVLQLDRSNEFKILGNAAKAGLAPEIVFADSVSGVLLCRGVKGELLDRFSLDEDDCLAEICSILKEVHELPLAGLRFEPQEAAEIYVHGLESHRGLHTFALQCEKIIAGVAEVSDLRCCHNDAVASNFIATPGLVLIDWEYACDNDPLFDLASLIGYHDLTDRQARTMLDFYSGGEAHRDRLVEQCKVFDAIQWLWLANRQVNTYNAANARRLEQLQQRIA